MPTNLENSAVATGLEKVSFHSNPKERQCQSMLTNYCTIALISHASKVMLKILQARFQQYVNRELSHIPVGFRKDRITRYPTSVRSSKKQQSSRKTSISALLTMPSLGLCGSQETVENSERDRNTRLPYVPPEKSVCRSGSNS